MSTEKLSSKESIEIITEMINTARGNMRGASFFFLLWGWVTVVGNLGQFALSYFTDYQHPYIVWLISVPVIFYTFYRSGRLSRNSRVRTHMDSVISNTWFAFLPCIILVIVFGSYFGHQITALIMLLAGFATFISGSVINYRPIKVGAVVIWLLVPVALILGIQYSPLIMALAIVAGYMIPGYMLKNSEK